jgi:UDP-2-acetamido-3-amino-2,3-dideoxy-glucuronate N-acetyltransferase
MVCAESGYRYREVRPGELRCLDLDEDQALPAALATGTQAYDDFKAGAVPDSLRMTAAAG